MCLSIPHVSMKKLNFLWGFFSLNESVLQTSDSGLTRDACLCVSVYFHICALTFLQVFDDRQKKSSANYVCWIWISPPLHELETFFCICQGPNLDLLGELTQHIGKIRGFPVLFSSFSSFSRLLTSFLRQASNSLMTVFSGLLRKLNLQAFFHIQYQPVG